MNDEMHKLETAVQFASHVYPVLFITCSAVGRQNVQCLI